MASILYSCPACQKKVSVAESSRLQAICPECGRQFLWVLAREGKKFGPFTVARLQQGLKLGRLQLTDMVLQEGTNKWIPASILKSTGTAGKENQNPSISKSATPAPPPASKNRPETRPISSVASLPVSEIPPDENGQSSPSSDYQPASSNWIISLWLLIRTILREVRAAGLAPLGQVKKIGQYWRGHFRFRTLIRISEKADLDLAEQLHEKKTGDAATRSKIARLEKSIQEALADDKSVNRFQNEQKQQIWPQIYNAVKRIPGLEESCLKAYEARRAFHHQKKELAKIKASLRPRGRAEWGRIFLGMGVLAMVFFGIIILFGRMGLENSRRGGQPAQLAQRGREQSDQPSEKQEKQEVAESEKKAEAPLHPEETKEILQPKVSGNVIEPKAMTSVDPKDNKANPSPVQARLPTQSGEDGQPASNIPTKSTTRDRRLPNQIDYAKRIDPEVSDGDGISRTAFLRNYPKAVLKSAQNDGFREYQVAEFPFNDFWAFVDEKIVGRRRYVVNFMPDRTRSEQRLKEVVDNLGQPDSKSLDDVDRKNGIEVRYRWFIPEANATIMCVLVQNSEYGLTFGRDVLNRRNDEEEAKRRGVNSVGMKLVYISAGKVIMGSPNGEKDRTNNEEQHEVEITQGFYMGAYEVTQAQYRTVMNANPSFFSAIGDGEAKVKGLDTDDFPVERVSWENATAFCKKLTSAETNKEWVYDLPTEAEWEYACRAGTRTAFHNGHSLSAQQANIENKLQRTSRVGSYEPNAWGLYDMHGNVWEWCKDWYEKDYYHNSPPTDPHGPTYGAVRVLRGGSWGGNAGNCRAAVRSDYSPSSRNIHIGFRVVARLSPR